MGGGRVVKKTNPRESTLEVGKDGFKNVVKYELGFERIKVAQETTWSGVGHAVLCGLL